jgi:auxin efflux carrier (AEC)
MDVIGTIATIIIIILIGYLTKYLGILKAEDAVKFNKLVIYIAFPSLIFVTLYNADLSPINDLFYVTLICVLVGVFSGLIAYLYSKMMRYPKKTLWGIVTTSTLSNSGFLGYPVILGVFGYAGLERAIFYDLGSSAVLFVSFAMIFTKMFGGKHLEVIKEAILFPFLWAFVLGILFNTFHFNIGNLPLQILNILSGAAVPLIMVSLGLSLDPSSLKNHVKDAAVVSTIKLIIAPLIALILVIIIGLGINSLNGKVIIAEAAMPSAMLSLVLAINYKLDFKAVSAYLFLNTILSLITLTIILILLSN